MRATFLSLTLCVFFLGRLAAAESKPLAYGQWTERPKLVVVIVIDQFRTDFLTRYEKQMEASKNGGLQYLKKNGAYFPSARYDILQSVTCPGHATILTGAYPAQMGIPLNEWYDAKNKRDVYCAKDEADEISPRRLIGTTVGDELKIARDGDAAKDPSSASRVVSLALKDRAAVMLGGHRSDLTFWMDRGQWQTSKYYANDGALPNWLVDLNKQVAKDFGSKDLSTLGKKEFEELISENLGVRLTTDAALSAVRSMKLGKGLATDILAISFSSHDILGHKVGLQDPKMESHTLYENEKIGELIAAIGKDVGFENVVFALTGDHGVAPPSSLMKQKKIDAGQFDSQKWIAEINTLLDKKWGKSPKGDWVLRARTWNFYLNPQVIVERKKKTEEVELAVKSFILTKEGVASVFTRNEFLQRKTEPTRFERQISKTYRPEASGDVVMIPKPFWTEKSAFATHLTAYNYDANVPLILAGRGIQAGVYPQNIEVIDLAPTLSFILGLVPPSGSEGRVLHEIF